MIRLKSKNGLTPKQNKFLEEYLIDENGTAAAIRAGYSIHSARTIAQALLKHPIISASIEEVNKKGIERLGITKERIVQELALIGFANIQDVIKEDEDGNTQINLKNMPRDKAAAIAELNIEVSNGKTTVKKSKVKLHDKITALLQIAKLSGYLVEKVDHNVTLTLEQLVEQSLKIENKTTEIEGEFTEVQAIG